MSDSQMKNIGQIQPAEKPAEDKINSAYQHSSPRSQLSRGEIHTSQHVGKNNRIARDVVYFHDDSPSVGSFKQKLELLSNNKLKKIKSIARSSSTARVFCGVHRLSGCLKRRYRTMQFRRDRDRGPVPITSENLVKPQLPWPSRAVVAQEFPRQLHRIPFEHLAHASNALLRRQRRVRASHVRLHPSRTEYHHADSPRLHFFRQDRHRHV